MIYSSGSSQPETLSQEVSCCDWGGRICQGASLAPRQPGLWLKQNFEGLGRGEAFPDLPRQQHRRFGALAVLGGAACCSLTSNPEIASTCTGTLKVAAHRKGICLDASCCYTDGLSLPHLRNYSEAKTQNHVHVCTLPHFRVYSYRQVTVYTEDYPNHRCHWRLVVGPGGQRFTTSYLPTQSLPLSVLPSLSFFHASWVSSMTCPRRTPQGVAEM